MEEEICNNTGIENCVENQGNLTLITNQFNDGSNKTVEVNGMLNLDQCVHDVLCWEKIINCLDAENADLFAETKSLRGQLEITKSNNTVDKKSVATLQNTVTKLQETLQKQLNDEAEIRSLREQLIVEQDRAEKAELALETEMMKYHDVMKTQQIEHAQQITKLQQDVNEESLKRGRESMEAIKQVRNALKDECSKRQELEKAHESEIVKLQMEYEGKLALVQAHNSRLQSNCSSSATVVNNEVFRKKLQHIQDEAAREINRLKEEVAMLRRANPAEGYDKNSVSGRVNILRPGILKRRKQDR